MKKYIPITNATREANFLKIEFYYNLGGMNYFTGRPENRGYYISVSPVYKNGITESYTSFTGAKQCLKAVPRKSEKAQREAIAIAPEALTDLIDLVCAKNNINVEAARDILNFITEGAKQ